MVSSFPHPFLSFSDVLLLFNLFDTFMKALKASPAKSLNVLYWWNVYSLLLAQPMSNGAGEA